MFNLFKNWLKLFKHMFLITLNEKKEFDKSTIAQAEGMCGFLTNKHAISAVAYVLDFFTRFEVESIEYQHRYSSLVGQSRRQVDLKDDLEKLKDNGGKQFQEFLNVAKCYSDPSQPETAVPCKSLSVYENSYVVYNELELFDGDTQDFPRLSSYKGPVI